MGSLLNTVATYYDKLKHQVHAHVGTAGVLVATHLKVQSGSAVAVLDQVERIVTDVVDVLPQSPFFAVVLDALK